MQKKQPILAVKDPRVLQRPSIHTQKHNYRHFIQIIKMPLTKKTTIVILLMWLIL